MFFVFRQVTWIPVRHSLKLQRKMEFRLLAFDSNVAEKKLVKAYRGTDNVQVGKMAAYQLGSALGKMGKVAVFSAQQKTKSVQDRVEGFMNNIGKYGDIEVVETIYSDQVDDMEASMKEVLEKYPTLDGVFCTNADITENVSESGEEVMSMMHRLW